MRSMLKHQLYTKKPQKLTSRKFQARKKNYFSRTKSGLVIHGHIDNTTSHIATIHAHIDNNTTNFALTFSCIACRSNQTALGLVDAQPNQIDVDLMHCTLLMYTEM